MQLPILFVIFADYPLDTLNQQCLSRKDISKEKRDEKHKVNLRERS